MDLPFYGGVNHLNGTRKNNFNQGHWDYLNEGVGVIK